MQPRYHLPEHAFTCCTGRYFVFLDLRSDRYFSIPTSSAARLARQVHGWAWTAESESVDDRDLPPTELQIAAQLISSGVLCNCAGDYTKAPRRSIPPAKDDVLSSSPIRENPKPMSLTALARALVSATYLLKRRPLESIVSMTSRRAAHGSPQMTPSDIHRAIELATTFLRYRPLYPRDYLCLFDSLALMQFLSLHNLHATWIFGVREDPFYAHCWVQAASTVLNDYRDRISAYVPIMAVQA